MHIGEKKVIGIHDTKRGYAAMWECGGGLTNTGRAQIITGRDGEKRRPVYVRTRGHLASGDHALLTVHNGFYVVNAGHHRGDFTISVWRIVKTSVEDIDGEKWDTKATLELVNRFDDGEWNVPLDAKFEAAVEAARNKARAYHTRHAYYIDTSEKSVVSAEEQAKRNEAARRQETERAEKRRLKAEADAEAKAEKEAERKAKADRMRPILTPRLEAVSHRREAIGLSAVEIDEFDFWCNYYRHQYIEENVALVERDVERHEERAAEKERKRQAREAFKPKFEAFAPRADSLGLSIEFDDRVILGDEDNFVYSEEGLARFEAAFDECERKIGEDRLRAEVEALYEKQCIEAAALGLPQDVEIWHRTGGRTNAGNGWVIRPDGTDREPTRMENDNLRRLSRYGEGFAIWEQVLPGELVLKWSKGSSAAPHHFGVVHLPPEGLTETQLEAVALIEGDIERDWETARGLASGIPSPPVGNGWGLTPRVFVPDLSDAESVLEEDLGGEVTDEHLSALRDHFNGSR